MTQIVPIRLNKLPFILSDIALLALAAVIVWRTQTPMTVGHALVCLGAIAIGAWFGILPFLREYQSAARLTEAQGLSDAVAHMQDFLVQTKDLRRVQDEIAGATAQMKTVQQHSERSVTVAHEISERLERELANFTAFVQKTQDTEKNHLRLEIDKLRRGERDWLQATVIILDHIYALNQAAARSGQPGLIAQLTQFQGACRDVVRRVGLVPYAPAVGDAFDPNAHQLEPNVTEPSSPSLVTEMLATGFTFQGELVRRALVRIGAQL